MDQAQVFLAAGLVCTLAFASFVLLDSDSEYPDWEVLEVCLAEHRSDISHIHAISIRLHWAIVKRYHNG